MPSVPKPRILGADGAGVRRDTGERVVLNPGIETPNGIHVIGEHADGTNAELIAVPESNVHPIPGDLSFEEAAAFPLVFETAYRMLVTRARLQEGEWVFAWGIGSGVSTAALAIAKALGARVIVTSSSDAKLARARELGADLALNHATEDVKRSGQGGDRRSRRRHRRRARRRGDVERRSTLAAPGGRIAVCGATTGPNPPAQLHRIWWKQLSILGSTMGTGADFAAAPTTSSRAAAPARSSTGLPARGDPRRARAHGGRRAAGQDRTFHLGSLHEAHDLRIGLRRRRRRDRCCASCRRPPHAVRSTTGRATAATAVLRPR